MDYDDQGGRKTRRKGVAMSDDDLRLLVSEEVSKAEDWANANIRGEQERNLQFYLGMPMGNEVEGRSQVVSWDVFEIIESAMPGFIEPFFSGDNIGEFEPRTVNDDEYVEQATDVVNYVIKNQNPGFNIFSMWIKDALLSKIGVVRAEWEECDPKKVELEDLSHEQFLLLMQDPDSEVVEHSAKVDEQALQQMQAQAHQMAAQDQQFQTPQIPALHDVTVLQKQSGKVCIENVRPENFVISRGAKSVDKARVVGEFITLTRSDINEMGHDGFEVSDFDALHSRQNLIEVLRDDLSSAYRADDTSDKSTEEVTLFRGYVRADVNGDGIAEYRRVLVGGNMVLENEEADWHDYCVVTPIIIPHRVVGMAYADPASEIQRLGTTLTRQYLDSLYAVNNPRTYVNMSAGVNLDDLLSTRINGLVRGNGPMENAISPLQTTVVSRDALEGIELAQRMRERRLGITDYNQGLDSEALNDTASGIKAIMGAADKRQMLVLRTMAETGIKDLFKLVLRLITKYQEKAETVRLRGKWVQYDPRGWNPEMDAIISVGIGSGDKTETVVMLQQYGQYMQWAQQNGVVTPQNIYEFGKMLAKNSKLMGADTKLLTQPNPNPAPPAPTPEQIKAEAEAQKVQFMAQHEEKMKQMELQDSAYKFQAEQQVQMQIDQNRQEWEARQKQLELQQQAELERIKAEYAEREAAARLEFERWKAELDASTKFAIAQMQAGVALKKQDDDMQKHEDGIVMGGYQSAREDAAIAREEAKGANDE